jgi:glycosyltransferase involved in cell wall biosynthesis
VAYHYPPVRSGGVERTVKFQRYLPEYGYRARVLTTSAFGRSGEATDPAEIDVERAWEPVGLYRRLAHRHAADAPPPSVVRTDPGRLRPVRRLVVDHLLIPDGQITWVLPALVAALRMLRRAPVAALYSTSPPSSAHLLALLLKRLTALPWLADFRDSWTDDPLDLALGRRRLRMALERRLERRVLRAADLVVAATSLSAELLRSSCTGAEDKVRVITNGFDPEDIGPRTAIPPLAAGSPVRLVHTGAFSASHPDRSPAPLFEALRRLVEADKAWASRLHLTLVGALTAAEAAGAQPLQRVGMVALAGQVPRRRALELQSWAHVLVLVDHPRPWPATNVPGKLYEYLAVGRPILALCGPGMAEQLIRELGAGRCVPPDDPTAIAAALVGLHADLRAGRGRDIADWAALLPYHRRAQAASLAGCFDELLAPARRRARNQRR